MANFRFPKLSDLKDPKRRLQLILLGGAALMGILFFAALFLPMTSNTSFCGKFCHSMEREYYTWQRSSHSNITCTACHVEQGLIPFFHEKGIEAPIGMIAEITGNYEKPINKESELGFHKISRETCERCHNLENRTVTPSLIFNDKMIGKGFRRYHSKHLKKGMSCTICHNRVTHKDVNDPEIIKISGFSSREEASIKYKNGMSMTEGCFRCHSPFPKEHDKHLIEKYKAEDAPKTCRTCHPKEMLPMGHGKNWIKEHPQQATKVGYEFCWKCHAKGKRFDSSDGKRSRCRDCHHRIIAKKTLILKNCQTCHEEMAFDRNKLVNTGQTAIRKLKQRKKAQYYRRMVYHKVHFPKKYKCTKCHLSDLETTKKPPFELCKNEGCHPPGQIKPPSGSKLCNKCHISPHNK